MSYINTFKVKCQSYMLNFAKLGKFSSQLAPKVNGNIYTFFSYNLSFIIYPMLAFLGLFRRPNYYPLFYKFGCNLFTISNFSFIQSVLNNFLLQLPKLQFYILKIFKLILVNSILFLNLFRKDIINIYANISSNCKIP